MPMRRCALLIVPLLLAPAAASARDVATCAALYKSLNNAPIVIGNNNEMRRYNQDLTQQYNQIRQLRIEQRRVGCSSGSVIVYGSQNNEACKRLQQELDTLESSQETMKAQRDNARKAMVKPSDERVAILASIRQNSCTPSDIEDAAKQEERERLKVHGLELPKAEAYSGVTNLKSPLPTQTNTQLPRAPDRPYDPTKKVRMVGPRFLPEASIDLAHPKANGPQPQQ